MTGLAAGFLTHLPKLLWPPTWCSGFIDPRSLVLNKLRLRYGRDAWLIKRIDRQKVSSTDRCCSVVYRSSFALAVLLSAASINPAFGQTGWIRQIGKYDDTGKRDLPAINGPQSDWSSVADIQSSDGTATVPPCGDLDVVGTVRDGILSSTNRQFQAAGGNGDLAKHASMSTVWVHPSDSGRYVCDVVVQLDIPFTRAEKWEFETFANDGRANVFFYDADSQN